MKIDGDVEVTGSQPPREDEVITHTREAGAALCDDDLREMGVAVENGRGRALDHISDLGLWILPSHRGDKRGRQDDVADEAQPDEEDLHTEPALPAGDYGSIVASSISITGMSSLIG